MNNNFLKIVSLVPSQTELLFDLGLNEEVIGITKFCIHPDEWFRRKRRVGGTKNLKLDLIRSLKPDLILANKEENVKDQIEELQKEFKVYVSEISTITDAFKMISEIGQLVNKEKKAIDIIENIKIEMSSINVNLPKIKSLYLIWQNPYMVAGSDTFINEMMTIAGFENIISNSRYPMLTIEEIKNLNPEAVLLSSEPFPFNEKHIHEMEDLLPNANIKLVDGELFSWYGSRMLKSFQYFSKLYEEFSA